ncbi:MAG: excinuclease ABC subunit UvrC [Planctomycetota bacterium]
MKRTDLPDLPTTSGTYLFLGPDGERLYIGKAKNLRARVSSYFGKHAPDKAKSLVRAASKLDFVLTRSEAEALILEAGLIKRYLPPYNVKFRDDKTYPYLKLTKEPYPLPMLTRSKVKDGADYFGPYPSAGSVRNVVDFIGNTFRLRINSKTPMRQRKRPCLRHHMGYCDAPCVGTSPELEAAYADRVEQARAVLEGREHDVVPDLEERMREAAARMDFELAGQYRNRLSSIRRLAHQESDVTQSERDNLDVVGYAQGGNYGTVQLFQMRRGRVIGRDNAFFTNADGAHPNELLERFLIDHYSRSTFVPPLLLVPDETLDHDVWRDVMKEISGKNVEIRTPQRGDKVRLLGMAKRNAASGLEAELRTLERRGEAPGISELQGLLRLEDPPYRIEGYDISNLQGSHTVASIVVFEGGRAKRSDYRKMRLRGLSKPDDFASMRQAIHRRFAGSLADKLPVPDLLLIDGGKGQLSAAEAGLADADVTIPIVGLAKRQETIVTQQREELHEPLTHPALRLLVAVRDEAHRTAVSFNRNSRSKAGTRSILEDIDGIGPRRRDAVLAHFSSIDDLRSASVSELARIPGIGKHAAEAIADHFSNES